MQDVGNGLLAAAIGGALLSGHPAHAQAGPPTKDEQRIRALEAQLRGQGERIAELERLLRSQGRLSADGIAIEEARLASSPRPRPNESQTTSAPEQAEPNPAQQAGLPRGLKVNGDLRLREEFNWSDSDGRDRARTALRARLKAEYEVTTGLSVGARVVTGDADDPNSADVTLGNFVDDFSVSLDQAFLRFRNGPLTVLGGKFPQPMSRSDLVWDGDVNPQGVAAEYAIDIGSEAKLAARAIYFILSESSVAPDSDMLGGQLAASVPAGSWAFDFAAAYYDYRLRSLAGADAGDFRSNLRAPDGTYLSDFNLGDVIASATYAGLGENWPVGLSANYVRNFGAVVGADEGYLLEVFAGRTGRSGDWRFGYINARAGVDAVFAAVSHDNLGIATNYRLHAVSVDYGLPHGTSLNLTAYRYRPDDAAYAAAVAANDWLNRVRLNLLFSF